MQCIQRIILVFLLVSLFFSCAKRNLSYFDNYDKTKVLTETISLEIKEPIVQTGDLLEIKRLLTEHIGRTQRAYSFSENASGA